jgi:hypothetical protein
MNTSPNVVYISDVEFQRRYSKVSEDIFGFGFEVEEAKKNIIADALEIAPYMNSREIGKFIADLGIKMAVAAERGKR